MMKKMRIKEMATHMVLAIATALVGVMIGVALCNFSLQKANEDHPHTSVYYNDEYLGEMFLDSNESIEEMYYTKLCDKKGVEELHSFDKFMEGCIYNSNGSVDYKMVSLYFDYNNNNGSSSWIKFSEAD